MRHLDWGLVYHRLADEELESKLWSFFFCKILIGWQEEGAGEHYGNKLALQAKKGSNGVWSGFIKDKRLHWSSKWIIHLDSSGDKGPLCGSSEFHGVVEWQCDRNLQSIRMARLDIDINVFGHRKKFHQMNHQGHQQKRPESRILKRVGAFVK